jgi:hypothetical protein
MKNFYVYKKNFKVYILIKVIECRSESEAYNKFSYLDDGSITNRIIIKTKLMTGLNVDNGDYKE